MQLNKKTLTIGLVILITALVIVGVVVSNKNISFTLKQPTVKQEETSKLLSPKDAYGMALVRAKQWQPDATLANSSSLPGETDKFGHSDDWQFLFTSKNVKKEGYRIVIENRVITKAEKIPYVGTGAELPENLISQEEAIAYVHGLTGYEKEAILGIEIYYNKDAKEWRWGVKTAKGIVSFKASR